MKRFNIEVVVGVFLLVGFLCFSYLAVKLGDIPLFEEDNYTVSAAFNSISGLKNGAVIELAGVRIGKVVDIKIDPVAYQAVVTMKIQNIIQLQEDSIASIRTSGIIGDKFIDISPGGAEEYIQPGGVFEDTESSISIEKLVSKYIFEKE